MKRLMFLLLASTLAAAAAGRGFSVDFSQCTEFAGVGPVDFGRASALVPTVFTPLQVGTTGGVVVRATSCQAVKVDGGHARATNISQIGIEIVAPDGTGDINNYTLLYVTDNPELAYAFERSGLPAKFDPTLTYQFTYDSTGKGGGLYVEVEGFGLPPYFLTGTETDPTTTGSDFKANWWYFSNGEVIKQASDFPDIAFGTADMSLFTDKNSFLGRLIGGNSDSDYHFLPVRGVYPAAQMEVTVSR